MDNLNVFEIEGEVLGRYPSLPSNTFILNQTLDNNAIIASQTTSTYKIASPIRTLHELVSHQVEIGTNQARKNQLTYIMEDKDEEGSDINETQVLNGERLSPQISTKDNKGQKIENKPTRINP